MASLTASQRSKSLGGSMRGRDSDFFFTVLAYGQLVKKQFIYKIPVRYTEGFQDAWNTQITKPLNNFSGNDFNLLSFSYDEKSAILQGKELYWSLIAALFG